MPARQGLRVVSVALLVGTGSGPALGAGRRCRRGSEKQSISDGWKCCGPGFGADQVESKSEERVPLDPFFATGHGTWPATSAPARSASQTKRVLYLTPPPSVDACNQAAPSDLLVPKEASL